MRTMKAAVIYDAGGPEILRIESRPVPVPQPGEVLIAVKAFGLNRSELFIFKKGDDGKWLIARYSFSPTNPPAR